MAKRVQSVKGTRDLLPPETAVWAAVEAVARRVFGIYGYGEIRTPVLEETELFVRGVGESTDIVGKEMYTFADKKGRSLTLRPENTAPVARAYVEHGMQNLVAPVKLFYIGPQFRYERPQKGRYRQFYQIGAEIIGESGPYSDAELLLMLVSFLRELHFTELVVLLNTVGDKESRFEYAGKLRAYLQPLQEHLSEDSRRRLVTNPLRILDTKDPKEKELLLDAPRLVDCLSDESRRHFEKLCDLLTRFGLRYRLETKLVRGLDYYSDTVFEIVSGNLGAQDAIVGGGRYDGLVASLGGPQRAAIGFAIGEDRLVDLLPDSFRGACLKAPLVAVASVDPVDTAEALSFAEELRRHGVDAIVEFASRSIKSVLDRASRVGCRFVVLIGEDELSSSTVTFKNLSSGEQVRLPRAAAIEHLKETA
ncbi:MAG TPA: histidine--tRNA ligase [Thermoanaerobaculia bacterium]|nr:histidine--tRNA ligase [Thermoanaerobaculia bacterium]